MFKLGGIDPGAPGTLTADLGEESDSLAEIFAAVSERRVIRFRYRGTHRRAHPYGLAHRNGHWYAVAGTSEGLRNFRVDRMDGVVATGEPEAFEVPAGFDVATEVPDAPWAAGEDEVEVSVRFDPDVAWWARRQLGAEVRKEEEKDGSLVAVIQVARIAAFIGWMISFDDHAEVLGPPEVRSAFVEHIRGGAG